MDKKPPFVSVMELMLKSTNFVNLRAGRNASLARPSVLRASRFVPEDSFVEAEDGPDVKAESYGRFPLIGFEMCTSAEATKPLAEMGTEEVIPEARFSASRWSRRAFARSRFSS